MAFRFVTTFWPRLAFGAVRRVLAIRRLAATEAKHRRSLELPGRMIPDPNASGFVQTAIGGRLSAPLGGFPPLGARVEAG